jgi:hypothetical protein
MNETIHGIRRESFLRLLRLYCINARPTQKNAVKLCGRISFIGILAIIRKLTAVVIVIPSAIEYAKVVLICNDSLAVYFSFIIASS